ncbi:SDR family NAD(P)-dependent oxidoreductase [Vibrio hepatarius]|uniref:SDR family NAD(P)-dependent oxidoreductase n=1 Tax=Vibrio hepatarius TaxID=171383 RepID=UPI001C088A8E|nr:SDR family NAD(P)-dependent oxidoreductase [Vibrio hepatarius]MBU2897853.1 SDR family NAD(P)-dependent oxidoreductase [Vibrio hepatarius]
MNTVLITGATSGIGLQLATDYAKSGINVYACGRNQDRLRELSSQFSNLHALAFDLTDLEATKMALSGLADVPDLWILNAGDCEYIDNGQLDAMLVKRVFDINVIGLTNAIEACQPYFKQGQRLAIVGSIASEVALPRAEAYGASKAAVSYLARALQLDLKPQGIEVSIIYPGFVKTPLTDKNSFEMPMLISSERASKEIREGLARGSSHIYFPKKFTSILRLIGALPYRWQNAITAKLLAQ